MLTRPSLNISLQALIQNWQRLKTLHGGGETAAVVKANAYGLGAIPVATALAQAGCKRFFVATLQEALELRQALPQHEIYVFQGVLQNEARVYCEQCISPVLNTVQQLHAWADIQEIQQDAPSPALHIDTAMNRLGLNMHDILQPDITALAKVVKPALVMTHYACASDVSHAVNIRQLQAMKKVEALLPGITTCYANSAAHFLPAPFHGNVTRPGCALYGINPCDDNDDSKMLPVASLHAPILQIREITETATISYAATEPVRKGMRTLTAGIGYADGIHRSASHKLYGYIGDVKVPLLGRVTMDMLMFDVSHVPEALLQQAHYLTLMNHQQTVDDLASIYNTIGYEVLTSLSKRVERNYQ